MDDNKPDEVLPVEQVPEEKREQEEEREVKEEGKEEDEKEVKQGEEEIGKEEEKEEEVKEVEDKKEDKVEEVEDKKEEKVKEVEEEKEEEVKKVEEEKEEEMEEVEEEKQGMSAAEATKDRPNSSGEEEDEQRVPVEEAEIEIKEIPPMSGTPPREQRAKKAQRTKRVNVSSKSTKQKVTSTVTSNQSDDVCDGSEEDLEEGEGGDEVAKVIQGIVHTMERVFRLIFYCFGFVCRLLVGIFGAVRRGLGVLFGAGLFAGVAYVIGTYVMTPVSVYEVMGFEARLKFLLRYQVWPTLPVFLAAVAGMVRRDNEVHRTYGRECFEQALMCLFNLLLLATHLEPSYLLYTGACVITATAFSLLHWFCLVYTKRRGSVFSLPGYLLNFGVMAYNLYVIFGQNLGYVPMSIEPEVHKITGSQGPSGAISYWNHVTMCHLVEQMFCKP